MSDISTDEQIAELERLHGAATPGELRGHGHYLSHVKNKSIDYTVEHLDEIGQIVKHYPGGTYFSPYQAIPFARREDSMWLAAIHNAFPAILRRLREADTDARNERAMALNAFAHIRDGGDPALVGHPDGSPFGDALREMLATRDARQRKLGAAEVWEQIARIGDSVTDLAIRVTANYAKEQAAAARQKAGE